MNKRKYIISALMTFIVLFIGIFLFQYLSKQKKSTIKQGPIKEVVRKVQTAQFSTTARQNRLEVDGRLVAKKRVDIISRVGGFLGPIGRPFKVGTFFNEGDILMNIDSKDFIYDLYAQRSNLMTSITQIIPDLKLDYPESFDKWNNYILNYSIQTVTPPLPPFDSDRERYFIGGKSIHSQFYSIKSLEQTLSYYSMTAPFSGVLSEVTYEPGTYVNPGTRLGQLVSNYSYEMSAQLPVSYKNQVKVGQTVKLYSEDLGKYWNGKVVRFSNSIDPNTQSLPIFISISGRELSEGMYLKGEILLSQLPRVMVVPRYIVADDRTIYTVRDSLVNSTKVEILSEVGDSMYIAPLDTDSQVITGNISGLFEGQKVEIINSNN